TLLRACTESIEVTNGGVFIFFRSWGGSRTIPNHSEPFFYLPDLKWPLPIRDLGTIHAKLAGVFLTLDPLVDQLLASARAGGTETGHPVNGIDGQSEAVGLIADGELQRRVDVALLFVAAHMDIVLTRPAVGEAMDEPGVSMEVEDHGFIRGENGFELTICQTVWVFGMRHQFKQVNDVHEPDLRVRQVLAQQGGGGQGLHCRTVADPRHDHGGFGPPVVSGPNPDSEALRAVLDRPLHVQILKVDLFIRDDDVDVVDAAQAMVCNRQWRVGISRQVN